MEVPYTEGRDLSERHDDELARVIKRALANPLSSDDRVDPMRELRTVLDLVGLVPEDAGGSVHFMGRDPIIASPLPIATMAAVALMAKSVSVAALWRERGGQGQDLSVHLGQALHRLCPFYDKKWEKLNGFAPGNPADPHNPFMPSNMYRTRDDRHILFMNIYPGIRSAALAFLNCSDSIEAVGAAIAQWDALDLEESANRAGLQATVIREPAEFLATDQFRYLAQHPIIEIEKLSDGPPEPFTTKPTTPLSGIRALGFSHVIAGPGMGRALAYHGADVLNLWTPNDFEMDFNYYTANIGLRSALLDFRQVDELARFRALLADADIFFSNRRPGLLAKIGLTSSELLKARPGLVQVEFSIYGPTGPWSNRIGFDHTAGGVTGLLALEGSLLEPKLPEIFVVNDYVSSWIGMVGAVAALRRRAVEGGSYRVRISLARISLWLLQMGLFDKHYAKAVAGSSGGHEYLGPQTFNVETPCGQYQGVTDQVLMTETPGSFATPLIPRGASKAVWVARQVQ